MTNVRHARFMSEARHLISNSFPLQGSCRQFIISLLWLTRNDILNTFPSASPTVLITLKVCLHITFEIGASSCYSTETTIHRDLDHSSFAALQRLYFAAVHLRGFAKWSLSFVIIFTILLITKQTNRRLQFVDEAPPVGQQVSVSYLQVYTNSIQQPIQCPTVHQRRSKHFKRRSVLWRNFAAPQLGCFEK